MSKKILGMINFSKTTWLIILLIVIFLVGGILAYQWWQTRKALSLEQIEPSESLTKQKEELPEETEEPKLPEEEGEVTITTDKTDYKHGD